MSGSAEFVGKKGVYKHTNTEWGNKETIRTDIVLCVALVRNMRAHIKGEAKINNPSMALFTSN